MLYLLFYWSIALHNRKWPRVSRQGISSLKSSKHQSFSLRCWCCSRLQRLSWAQVAFIQPKLLVRQKNSTEDLTEEAAAESDDNDDDIGPEALREGYEWIKLCDLNYFCRVIFIIAMYSWRLIWHFFSVWQIVIWTGWVSYLPVRMSGSKFLNSARLCITSK